MSLRNRRIAYIVLGVALVVVLVVAMNRPGPAVAGGPHKSPGTRPHGTWHKSTTTRPSTTTSLTVTTTVQIPSETEALICADIRQAITRDDPNYGPDVDADNDGIGCEAWAKKDISPAAVHVTPRYAG